MKSFQLQIVTPDGEIYNGPAEKILLRTTHGDICILARHIDYVTSLGMGECRLTLEGGESRRAFLCGGMVIVGKESTRVVTSAFEWTNKIDVDRAQRSKARAEKALADPELPESERHSMEVRVQRANLRLKLHE